MIIGSKSKPEGAVQTSILTERSIDIAENRIEPGKSLVIGGMRKAENRSVIRGIPFFRDIPIIGILFSSKDYEESATEIIFILTPSISSGGVDYDRMADVVREKFETPEHTSDWDEFFTDPMGTEAYSDVVGKETDVAELERIRLEVQTAEVNRQAEAEQLRAKEAAAEAEAMKAQVREAQAEIEKAIKELEEAKMKSQKAQEELQKTKRKTDELAEIIEKAQQEVITP